MTQPNSTLAETTLNQVTVKEADKFGNVVSGPTVEAAATLSASSLSGTTSLPTDGTGQAGFATLSVNTVGTFTILATSAGATSSPRRLSFRRCPWGVWRSRRLAALTGGITAAGSNLGAVTVLALNTHNEPVAKATIVVPPLRAGLFDGHALGCDQCPGPGDL